MTFGIAIPCWYKDVHYIDGIIENISYQTIKPDKISISVSEVNSFELKNNFGLDVVITTTTEPKLHSENRNIASEFLQTDIISFIDCDDFMHPQRTEFLLHAFAQSANAVLHNFEPSGELSTLKNTQTFEEFMGTKYISNEFFLDVIRNTNKDHLYPIWEETTIQHNAHVTVKREIFEQYKYNPNLGWTADSDFNTRLVLGGYKISYIKNKLSWYRTR